MNTFLLRIVFCTALISLFAVSISGRTVVGISNTRLSGPITGEIKKNAKTDAAKVLKRELYIWIKEKTSTVLDTTKRAENYVLDEFQKRCLKLAKKESTFEGKVWKFSYSLTDNQMKGAIATHNQHFDSLAQSSWQQYRTAKEQNDYTIALSAGIKALSCAVAHLGPKNKETENEADIRKEVQEFFDRMQVKSSAMMIEGNPGTLPEKSPEVTVLIDSTPLLGFGYTAFVQKGRNAFQIITDEKGGFSLSNFKIPFVHNGSFLRLVPDAAFYTDAKQTISLEDLGLDMNRGQNLSFIYKVSTPTYSLEYKTSSHKEEVKMPEKFISDSHIRRFLRDSCNLKPAPSGTAPDLQIRINAEVSRPEYPESGEASLMLLSRIDITGMGLKGSGDLQYEKRHEKGADISLGVFFWEASKSLRSKIREVLNNL
ncbi:MAG: hypothetical protein ACLFQB_04825 [Chitinispirillaceae bacterium]